MREAFNFFRRLNGCIGRHALAGWRLAQAEQRARARVHHGFWRYRWEEDPSPDLSWLQEGETVEEVLGCILEAHCPECGRWRPLQSLWGITDPDADCRRCIEAELALEELDP